MKKMKKYEKFYKIFNYDFLTHFSIKLWVSKLKLILWHLNDIKVSIQPQDIKQEPFL